MSTPVRIDRQVEPLLGVTCADVRDALALLEGWRKRDPALFARVAERADGDGMCKALMWLLAETIDGMGEPDGEVWLAHLRAQLHGWMTGEG